MAILEGDMKVQEVDRVSGDFPGELERRQKIADIYDELLEFFARTTQYLECRRCNV